MNTDEWKQLKKEERTRDRAKRSQRFWRSFLFTENGTVKSTLLLNSFCLSVVCLVVYIAAFYVLIDLLHPLVAERSVFLINLVEAFVPALAGTAVCSLAWFLSKEKRLLPATYLWLTLMAVACFITMLVILGDDAQARGLFFQFFALFVPAPVLTGGALSFFLYLRYRKKRALPPELQML
ncbi:MAG: hypothetical protein RR288_04820 [Oscillibacter sp.]